MLPPTTWLVDPDHAYLNHGGFGALPQPVADAAAAIRAAIEANPTDMLMRRWQPQVDAVRERVAAFLRTTPASLVFVPNATAGTATVLASLDWQSGDEVVATDHRYPAVASQLGVLLRHGVKVVEQHVPVDVASTAQIVEHVMSGVTDKTKLVVVDHIASPTGFVFPVADIVAAAHERGLPVLVDAAHAPGQLDVDLDALGADFWVGNLHKWVCSPRGCAALVVAPRWRDVVRPLVASHGYADGYHDAFDWTGTADAVPLLAIPAALDFWDGLGWDAVRRHQHELATTGAHAVADALGTEVVIADEFTAAMRLVRLPVVLAAEAEREKVAYALIADHGVTAHITEHAGTTYVRMCGQLYNTPEHYERLGKALRAIL
ncbi:MAG: aminotransferase class V-fold PLP-dependent enzyme [Frankiaceae bacterium]|nr:aminotransferase class V-fold PLP-dependent enzyme [Frankiaceae bacterium]MBV9369617.1 aminotransferase class V-fold PLP-dependent enzyme [Frankiales bacterium]